MPILNRAAELHPEVAEWRRHLHANPELGFEVHGAARFIAERLASFGCDRVETGIGRTGVVATVRGTRGPGPTVALRADCDALPIVEESGRPWASRHRGRMHACGHDGHSAMLLGAARHLAETRNFAGTVVFVFEPAEELGEGAKAMIADDLFERFGIEKIFGMHNMPGIPTGHFAIRPGAMMASSGKFRMTVAGRGGHAARPQSAIDPIPVTAAIVTALQGIVARQTDPLASAVVSVTRIEAGTAFNIIPETVEAFGTVRALDKALARAIPDRIRAIGENVAAAHGAAAAFDFDSPHPVVENAPAETRAAEHAARLVAGDARVDPEVEPVLAGEDFSYMLQARPGAFIFIGNGGSAGLHHPAYDFDDAAIPEGISYWVALAETLLAPAEGRP